MQHGGVRARRHNRLVAVARAAILAEDVAQRRLDLVFVHSRSQSTQRGEMAIASNLDGAAQQREVVSGLD